MMPNASSDHCRRVLLAMLFLLLSLSARADETRPAAARAPGVCEQRSLFPQCGVLGSPCCLGSRFYFDPRAHQLPAALDILSRVADRDLDEARRQLGRLRDAGRLRNADALRAHPKLAELYAALPGPQGDKAPHR